MTKLAQPFAPLLAGAQNTFALHSVWARPIHFLSPSLRNTRILGLDIHFCSTSQTLGKIGKFTNYFLFDFKMPKTTSKQVTFWHLCFIFVFGQMPVPDAHRSIVPVITRIYAISSYGAHGMRPFSALRFNM